MKPILKYNAGAKSREQLQYELQQETLVVLKAIVFELKELRKQMKETPAERAYREF